MKILGITDIHNRFEYLQNILYDAGRVDLVLLGGDLTNFGTPEDAEKIVHAVQCTNTPVLAVAGNCDSAQIDQHLRKLGVSVAGRGVIVKEAGVHGLSAAPPWRKGMYELEETELAGQLRDGYMQVQDAQFHVVLAHVPPQDGNVDRTRFFQHVGSSALREFIDEKQPALVVCGHIHEARGVEQFGRTTVVNCGPAASGYYVIAELSDKVSIDLRRC
jgi:uncharacterized protein